MARAASAKAVSRENVLAERLARHCLSAPLASSNDYPALFRLLQPVGTGPWARPGSPPTLVHRTQFDDTILASRLRAQRKIVKGRFRSGGVGYVHADDLALYANAFQAPLSRPNDRQRRVLDAVLSAGPLTPRQLKDETGLLNKQIMPALHRLQQAFLVYEDQTDDEWDRAWYDFSAEWPDVEVDPGLTEEARLEVVLRFVRSHVFATSEQIADWSGFPARRVAALVGALEGRGSLEPAAVEGLGEGWIEPGERPTRRRPPKSVFMLDKGDPWVRAHESELERRFEGREVLQYLLIDGVLAGAVCGHWRFKPYDVEDIALELPAAEAKRREKAILRVVGATYEPPRHPISRYAGRRLDR